MREDEFVVLGGREANMVYNRCATLLLEEFEMNRDLFRISPAKDRFFAVMDALHEAFRDHVRSPTVDTEDEAAARWTLDDVSPNSVRYEFYEQCKRLRADLKAADLAEGVYEYRPLARELFDRIGEQFASAENGRINVVDGNFETTRAYMTDVVDACDWLSWYGVGRYLDTLKLRIVV